MKYNKITVIISLVIIITTAIILMACNKKFDAPPNIPLTLVDTSITNHLISISTLKKRHTITGLEAITDNCIITGIVGGDDENGNLYKQITLQDSTGGIAIILDRSSLYIDYPVGRRLYIKCRGLYISDYNHSIQLGSLNSSVPTNLAITSIPAPLFDQFIIKGSLSNPITPTLVTLAQLNTMALLSAADIVAKDTLQSVLVQLNDVELAVTDLNLIYADTSAAKKSVNRNITDCKGTAGVVLYTSGFANFAGFTPPTGKGSIVGIYTPYKTTAELVVRDTSDVKLYDTRCGSAAATTLFSEIFSGITNKATITTTGSGNSWKNIAEVGGKSFVGYVSGTTHLASVSAYGATGTVTSWMITQAINIPQDINSPSLTFTSTDGYDNGASFKLMVSTNYGGSNSPSSSTWTQLPAIIPTGDAKFGKSTNSGNVDLSAYIGQTIYLGWRYDGSTYKNTTYEFGNIKVTGY